MVWLYIVCFSKSSEPKNSVPLRLRGLKKTMSLKFTSLGCSSSTGVPAAGNYWGACDPNEPKNRRTKCSLAVQSDDTTIIIDTGADFRHQMNMFDINNMSKPNTTVLMAVAYTIGQMVGMYFKDFFACPRPSQLLPTILTAIPSPQHPAFPSNHALQNYLVLNLLTKVIEAHEKSYLYPHMAALADRIAVNREIAGLHFATDTDAGIKIASWLTEYHLLLMPNVSALITEARKEWPDSHEGTISQLHLKKPTKPVA